ncbi:MAG: phosphate ABC transporter substrate-binding protein [Glaciecola sp.]
MSSCHFLAVGLLLFSWLSFAQQPVVNQQTARNTSANNTPVIELPNNQAFDASDYRSTPGVYGTITSVGSDTLAGLMAIWAQRFQEIYPHVKFQIQASGSATASQALTQGSASIGPMSRALSAQEIALFTSKHGYPPTALVVAIDAIALYVEENNPLTQLTLQQVDAVFSATRLCGYPRSLETWQSVGVSKFGSAQNIQIFGRNSASGTYDLFKQKALCDGDYKRTMNEMPSSSSVVQSVASSIGALGYAALGYQSTQVKTLSLSANGTDYYAPSPDNLREGNYPFTRFLYIVVNKAPNETLPALERTFLSFVLSPEGQRIVSDDGYFQVSSRVIKRQRAQILNTL